MSRFSNIGRYWQHTDLSTNILTADVLMQAGVKIFPCREGGSIAKSPYTARGFHAACRNPATRKIWSEAYSDAVWGLPCAANGVLAVDADLHGNGDGVANLNALFQKHGFDRRSVPAVTTPNRGMHFYFSRPPGLGKTRGTLCQAVDVRDNAYVISPGCRMADGRLYELVEGTLEQFARAVGTRSLPEPPEWMLAMLLHPPRLQRVPSPMTAHVDDEILQNQIKGILKAVLKAEEGNRNRLLFWAACRFAEMIRTELVAYELAEALLERAGDELGLSAREIRSTLASGFRQGWEGDHDGC